MFLVFEYRDLAIPFQSSSALFSNRPLFPAPAEAAISTSTPRWIQGHTSGEEEGLELAQKGGTALPVASFLR